MSLVQLKLETSLVTLYLVASPHGLVGVHWQPQEVETGRGAGHQAARDILRRAKEQLTQYLAGQRREFELALDVRGSEFQKSVWRQLGCIPYGQTRSYKEVAVSLGKEGAFRAVGNANANNPLCIVVPCHRIIASRGALGGYSGGVHIKERLLALERDALRLSGRAAPRTPLSSARTAQVERCTPGGRLYSPTPGD